MKKLLLLSMLLIEALLTGCLMEPEQKPDHVITIDCRNSFDYRDSANVAHSSCPILPPMPSEK